MCVSHVGTFAWAHAVILKLDVSYGRPVADGSDVQASLYLSTSHCTITLVFWTHHLAKERKNIFICFPGGSHNGLYLFNKVNPYKLQRLHWGGVSEDTLLVFSDLEWAGCSHDFSNMEPPPYIVHYDVLGLFHFPLLPWQHFISKCIICPLGLLEGGPWNAVRPTYGYGLISNCLFLRIIPNGCAAKPLSTLSWD